MTYKKSRTNNYSKGNDRKARRYTTDEDGKRVAKHSGCHTGTFKEGAKLKGKAFVQGWKWSKSHGMLSFLAFPYSGKNSKTEKHVGEQNGNTWYNWVVKVYHDRTKETKLHTCLANATLDKIIIEELSFVMNTKAPNGGYVGPYYERSK
jgi:hypothetical protein